MVSPSPLWDGEVLVLGLTSFLDDSISHDRSPIAAIGGPAMSRIGWKELAQEWGPLLREYRIPSPLHMADFVRPSGKHIGMHKEMKLSLFRDVAAVVNRHKRYSISISVPSDDFSELLPAEAQKELISPYALAFCCAVLMNQGIGKHTEHGTKVAYLVDDGCAHKDHIENVHSRIQNLERDKAEFRYTGAIGFSVNDDIPSLQAADVISWSARRREVYGVLEGEFEPLQDVLRAAPHRPPHAHVPIPRDGIDMWARPG